jgi:hypothetical protein
VDHPEDLSRVGDYWDLYDAVLVEEYGRGVPTTEKIVRVLERHAEIALKEGRYAESNMYLALIRRLFVLLVDEERRNESVDGSSRVVVYDLGGPTKHIPEDSLRQLCLDDSLSEGD